MAIVDTALADQWSHGARHSRRDESPSVRSSAAAVSRSSGKIDIGRPVEVGEEKDDSQYSSSDYDDEEENCADPGDDENYSARAGDRTSTPTPVHPA